MREEMLEVFLEFIEDENHSILLSSHITSDLEKIADYITFLHEGKVLLTVEKDEILYHYGILRCRDREFEALDKEDWNRLEKERLSDRCAGPGPGKGDQEI